MSDLPSLWMRHEVRETERRAPIVPADAAQLVAESIPVTVERSDRRCFPIEDYARAGCRIVPAGSWVDAPSDQFVIGLKELPELPAELTQRHVYFGHAYKAQPGSERLLRRFQAGGGALLDIEYLTDDNGRRLAAFGYWAGYVGAALAVLQWRGRLTGPLRSGSHAELDAQLTASATGDDTTAVVIGALGRSGRGACDALAVAGIRTSAWDQAETAKLDRTALIGHDLLVNTVLVHSPVPPFLTAAELADPDRRLRVVCDVTCDAGSPFNVLPIYDELTSWQQPARALVTGGPPLDLIAIDNLPALVPQPASVAFSAELTPQLRLLGTGSSAWLRCQQRFEQASQALGTAVEGSDD